jgi:hypothetical protein
MKVFQFADKTLQIRSGDQGWLDSQHFLSTFLINFIGGDCMSDVDILESDTGLNAAISKTKNNYIKMNNSYISKRFRKGHKRVFLSNNALANYALKFHNDYEEEIRKDYIKKKELFIPKLNNNLRNLGTYS